MPTIFAHPAVAIAAWPWLRNAQVPLSVLLAGAACTVVPDLDVVGLRIGIPYESLLGHRGLSHSLPFAAFLAAVLAIAFRPLWSAAPVFRVFLFLFVCAASHGILDALTSRGHGVAFFAPFHDERYFFPWQPIEVSPLSIRRFVSPLGLSVLASELRWVGAPMIAVAALGWLLTQRKPNDASKKTAGTDRGAS